jgi:hypothetical protein
MKVTPILINYKIMETEKQLNAKILAKILSLKAKYPELSGCLSSAPISIHSGNSQEIHIKVLKEYYESINNIL